jgi:3-oxoacyl-[acyl-carrier protein] reductase
MNAKVAIVSGGSRGLGKGFVESLLAADYRVATFSRSPSEFTDKLAREPAYSGRFIYQSLDQTNSEQLQAFVKRVVSEFGRLDILVNNAAIARDGLLPLMSENDIDQVLAVNMASTLKLTRHCVRHMLTGGGGKVINISSIIGQRGYRGLAVYAATKGGMDAMTRSLARELGERGIVVNSIAPGYLRTEMSHGLDEKQMGQIVRRTPLGRLGEVADVVGLLLFLCSDGSNFITGQTFVVDGGLTV